MKIQFKNSLFLLVGLLLVVSLTKNVFEYQKRKDFFSAYNKQLQLEVNKNKKLKGKIAQYKDYTVVEELIREKLNRTKKQEYVVLEQSNQNKIDLITPTPKPTYRQWLDLFLH